mmetsp:Transcript_57500/g.136783  ORF Transcript_57500/g.136783 Transcript_57500/m.136783 type:complete len:256 (+) Transcript_57500:523-1290(+)
MLLLLSRTCRLGLFKHISAIMGVEMHQTSIPSPHPNPTWWQSRKTCKLRLVVHPITDARPLSGRLSSASNLREICLFPCTRWRFHYVLKVSYLLIDLLEDAHRTKRLLLLVHRRTSDWHTTCMWPSRLLPGPDEGFAGTFCLHCCQDALLFFLRYQLRHLHRRLPTHPESNVDICIIRQCDRLPLMPQRFLLENRHIMLQFQDIQLLLLDDCLHMLLLKASSRSRLLQILLQPLHFVLQAMLLQLQAHQLVLALL